MDDAEQAAQAFDKLNRVKEDLEAREALRKSAFREGLEEERRSFLGRDPLTREEEKRSIQRNEGYFQAPLGYIINGGATNYIIVDKKPLGVGVFSTVYPCADKDNKLIALKVIRGQDHFRKYAEAEISILERINELAKTDVDGSDQILMLREHFVHTTPQGQQHLCLSFAHLFKNLRDIGKLQLDRALVFTKQLVYALRYLHDTVTLVHCDVKPDNLLVRHDEKAVKLCDFGTARMVVSGNLQTQDELQPLFYRAPEVFMGAPRKQKIDIWSLGCTVYELVVGRVLFRACLTHRDVVEKIMTLRGPIPLELRQQGRQTKHYFSDKGFHREAGGPVDPMTTFKKKSMKSEMMPFVDFGKSAGAKLAQEQAKDQLSKLIGSTCVVAAAHKKRKTGPTEADKKLQHLGDFVEKCMDVDPVTRASASELCNHVIFEGVALPPAVELQEAPPLPAEEPPPLPPGPGPEPCPPESTPPASAETAPGPPDSAPPTEAEVAPGPPETAPAAAADAEDTPAIVLADSEYLD